MQRRADILFPNTKENENQKTTSIYKDKNEYRNKLLNYLGDSLDRVEILYSREFELENKILNNTIEHVS